MSRSPVCDLIAAGLSPLRPRLAAVEAGRVFLHELDRLASSRTDFAFESTLSGRSYADKFTRWKKEGYQLRIAYLRLASVDLALERIRNRVRQGGHDVPRADVVRRFGRSWDNFKSVYRPLAHTWAVYDNSGSRPELLEESK